MELAADKNKSPLFFLQDSTKRKNTSQSQYRGKQPEDWNNKCIDLKKEL